MKALRLAALLQLMFAFLTASPAGHGVLATRPEAALPVSKGTRGGGGRAAAEVAFERAARLDGSAAHWRALANVRATLGDHDGAWLAFSRAASRYSAAGDAMTARATLHLAAPHRQRLSVMLEASTAVPVSVRRARLEPRRGLLLGVHVSGAGVMGAWGQPPRMTREVAQFPVAFRYWLMSASRDPARIFPGRFARAARASGQAVHLALEPGMPLAQISDRVIADFVREARAADVPLFIRFASEMNDPGNAWSRDPALYHRTFRRLAAAIHRRVPKAVMVWMPMPGDLARMAPYYLGREAVDWAGLSLYSVPFENGDRRKTMEGAHALSLVDPFYRRYSGRHPPSSSRSTPRRTAVERTRREITWPSRCSRCARSTGVHARVIRAC